MESEDSAHGWLDSREEYHIGNSWWNKASHLVASEQGATPKRNGSGAMGQGPGIVLKVTPP